LSDFEVIEVNTIVTDIKLSPDRKIDDFIWIVYIPMLGFYPGIEANPTSY
jgi:hypothetical protein